MPAANLGTILNGRTALRGLALVALLMACVPATEAHGAAVTSLALYSDSGDFIGRGQPRVFTAENSTLVVRGDASDLELTARTTDGTNQTWDFAFAAPRGESLRVGVYDDAERAAFRDQSRPGIDIGGDGRGCSSPEGRFEVKDIGVANGTVERLWIVFEQHCGLPASYGEIRLNQPVPDGSERVTPSIVRWPADDVGRTGQTVPVAVEAAAPTTFGPASVIGADGAAFPLVRDDCAGRSLAAGDSCQAWVRLDRTRPGTRLAELRFPHSRGQVSVPLEGWSYGGVTSVEMRSDEGDFVGQGMNWVYDTGNAFLGAGGSGQHVQFSVNAANRDSWSGDFAPPPGGTLAAGHYAGAQRYAYRGASPGLEVSGKGRGCNVLDGDFTIREIALDRYERVQRFAAEFVQHCERKQPALRGKFSFREGDRTPGAPWMPARVAALGADGDGSNPSGGGSSGADSPAGRQGSSVVSRARLILRGRALRVTRAGRVPITLRCPTGQAPCQGTVAMSARRSTSAANSASPMSRKRAFNISAGHRLRLKLALTGRSLRAVRRARRIPALLSVRTAGAVAEPPTERRRVKLLAPRR
jgi:hypothetical protein